MTEAAERPEAAIPRRALRYGLVLTGIVAVLGAGVGFLVSGPTGLISGLIGAAVAAIFFRYGAAFLFAAAALVLALALACRNP